MPQAKSKSKRVPGWAATEKKQERPRVARRVARLAYSMRAACEALGVGPEKMKELIASGKIKARRTAPRIKGGHKGWIISAASLAAWVENGE